MYREALGLSIRIIITFARCWKNANASENIRNCFPNEKHTMFAILKQRQTEKKEANNAKSRAGGREKKKWMQTKQWGLGGSEREKEQIDVVHALNQKSGEHLSFTAFLCGNFLPKACTLN